MANASIPSIALNGFNCHNDRIPIIPVKVEKTKASKTLTLPKGIGRLLVRSIFLSKSFSQIWLNELEDPAEDITEEVIEEADEHQVFFTASSGLPLEFTYVDVDSNGNPLGTQFIVAPTSEGATGSGTITITLVHEPEKPNDGLSTAGGETDIEVTFDVVVE